MSDDTIIVTLSEQGIRITSDKERKKVEFGWDEIDNDLHGKMGLMFFQKSRDAFISSSAKLNGQ